jgi:hypothetical protein
MCVQAQPLKRMLPNAKKAIKGDDGTDIYYMDGLVVAQVFLWCSLGLWLGQASAAVACRALCTIGSEENLYSRKSLQFVISLKF